MMDKKTIISAFGVAVAAALAFSAISYGDDDPASIQHRYMTPSMRVSTNAWLSVSGRVERTVADATDGFLRTEKDPLFTAWKKGASVAAGSSANANASLSVAIGADSQASDWATAVGYSANAVNQLSTSIGSGAYSEGVSSVAIGSSAYASDNDSVAIGKDSFSHGVGTFNVNATTPSLFYLGDRTLQSFLDAYAKPSVTNGLASKEEVAAVDNKADEAYSAAEQMVDAVNSLSGTIGSHIRDTDNPHKVTAEQVGAYTRAEVDSKIESAVLPTDPTFSNAVLAVGLNIDTDSVAVLNEIASTFGGFPIEGTATTVGGLLAALAAAVAWLRRNKADKATTLTGYGITDAATKTELAAKADKSVLDALAAKVDAANAALEEVA